MFCRFGFSSPGATEITPFAGTVLVEWIFKACESKLTLAGAEAGLFTCITLYVMHTWTTLNTPGHSTGRRNAVPGAWPGIVVWMSNSDIDEIKFSMSKA